MLASVYITTLLSIADLGMPVALIQARDVCDVQCDSVFWLNQAVAIALAGGTWIFRGSVAAALGDPSTAQFISALAVAVPITAVGAVPNALLSRGLRFDALTARDVAGEAAYALVALSLAWAGLGAWSLIGAILSQRGLRSVLAWRGVVWRPRLRFSRTTLVHLWRFGSFQLLSLFTLQVIANMDYFAIGRVIGVAAVGAYALAFQLAVTPMQQFGAVLRSVLFPLLSREGPKTTAAQILDASVVVLATLGSVFIVLVSMIRPAIGMILGARWGATATLIGTLALVGSLSPIEAIDSGLLAAGRSATRWCALVLKVAVFATSVVVFKLNTLSGIAGALFAATFIALTLTIGMALRYGLLRFSSVGVAAVLVGFSVTSVSSVDYYFGAKALESLLCGAIVLAVLVLTMRSRVMGAIVILKAEAH